MIDGYATMPVYLEHLAPVWLSLWEAGVRPSDFWVPPGLLPLAEALGIGARPLEAWKPPGLGPLLVASYRDLHRAGDRPIILAEHGAGQSYGGSHASYAGGPGRQAVVLFLVPGAGVGLRNAERYPGVVNVPIGCPKLDAWHAGLIAPRGGAVAISFHWDAGAYPETRSAFRHYRAVLAELPRAFGEVIGHAHPRWFAEIAPIYAEAGIEPVESFEEVLRRADVYACDNSSTLYEFASTGRPVAVLNAPWYRRKVSHGMRFWDHARIGPQCDEPTELAATIAAALEDPPPQRAVREAIVDEVYAVRDGTAGRSAALAIRSLV